MRAPMVHTGLLLALLLSACSASGDLSGSEDVVLPVVQGEIVRPGLRRNFSVTGEVSASKEARITAEFKADVVSVSVKAGDLVKKGDVLVVLSSENVQERYQTANASYATARENVDRTRESGERSVEAARIQLRNAERNLEDVMKQNNARRRQAEEQRESSRVSLDLSAQSASTQLESAISTTKNVVENALTDSDRILEFTPLRNDENFIFETHIGVKDPTFKTITQESLLDTFNLFDDYVSNYSNALELLDQIEDSLEMTLTVLNRSVTSPRYTQNDLDGHLKTITGHLNSIRTQRSQVISANDAVETALQDNTDGESQTLINANVQYEATIADLDAAESAARQQLANAEAQLQTSIASAQISNTSARTGLTSAQGELDQSRVENDKRTLIAPFEGRVAGIQLKVGDEVNPGDLLAVVENVDQLKITTSLSANEVEMVHVGDSVVIDDEYLAKISSIAPSADSVSKKFPVEIYVEEEMFQPGSFVKLTFSSRNGKTDERMYLPVTAVHISAAETFVWELLSSASGVVIQKAPVEIGELQGEFVEIESGVISGMVVVQDGGRRLKNNGEVVTIENETILQHLEKRFSRTDSSLQE